MKKRSGVKVLVVLILIAAATVLSVSPLVNNINLGLDLQGGAQVVLQAIPDEGESLTSEDMSQLVSVLDQRVNELGVSEPIIQVEGTDRIIVELAGVDNPEAAIELIGKTAKLEFRDPNGEIILTGENLKDAYPVIDQQAMNAMQQNQVILEFDSEGADLFFEATAAFTGQLISIHLDDEVIQSATVKGPISGGSASISGGFATFQEASNLAALLRGGALPVDLEIMSKSTVGPTLGADSLSKSLNAAAIGFIVLFLFMLVYYRLPGGWACCSLLVYALLLMWSLYLINATLTLTSIAGFILSVGVAVDSNIIIYERIREELYHGKSLKASVEAGFKRALWTILDSNITTLIAALVLYFFGSGTIKGFALTLAIGLIASMFTAITFTRYMLRWTTDVNFLSSKKLYGM
ncbi:MAG: protein translocase subunit SecD [Firmicutes bacterium]|nr:protein translocase subunit SecD [Bacillota bacterium]